MDVVIFPMYTMHTIRFPGTPMMHIRVMITLCVEDKVEVDDTLLVFVRAFVNTRSKDDALGTQDTL